jgi:subtilisin-like proprotein convertase family protein
VQNLAGNRDANNAVLGPRPDSKQGWGRLRADRLLADATPSLLFDQFVEGQDTGDTPPTVVFDATGGRWDQVLVAADPAQPMTLVLSWTDAPGHGLGGSTPAWNNNLDLLAAAGGVTYFGNVFNAGGISIPGGSADARNNIEVVVLPGAVAAEGVEVGVIAASLSADALPNRSGATDQDFALACINCELGNTFAVQLDTPSLQICGPAQRVVAIDLAALGGYSGSVDLDLSAPAGVSGVFSADTVSVPGSSILSLDIATPAAGSQPLVISADDGSAVKSRALMLNYSAALPGSAALSWPTAALAGIGLRPTLRWSAAANAPTGYRLELATDAAFSATVVDQIVSGSSHTPQAALQPDTAYWWRVTPLNYCGEAIASAAGQFRTAAPTCSTLDAGSLPLDIGPGSGVQTNARFVYAGAGRISSVEIPLLTGTHTYLGDLSASLIAPDGGAAAFWSRICGANDNFNFGFSDGASLAFNAIPCPATRGLVYRPAAPLAGLAGRDAQGSWTLRITDNAGGDGGSLSAARLRICAVDGLLNDPTPVFADGFEG